MDSRKKTDGGAGDLYTRCSMGFPRHPHEKNSRKKTVGGVWFWFFAIAAVGLALMVANSLRTVGDETEAASKRIEQLGIEGRAANRNAGRQ